MKGRESGEERKRRSSTVRKKRKRTGELRLRASFGEENSTKLHAGGSVMKPYTETLDRARRKATSKSEISQQVIIER